MNRVDLDRLQQDVRDALSLAHYEDGLAGAWLVGSTVRRDKAVHEGSDVDVVLAFSDAETLNAFEYERGEITVPIYDALGDPIGTQHVVDVDWGREDKRPRDDDCISIL